MGREHNMIDTTVPLKYEITDEQLGNASSEMINENPTAAIGYIGRDEVLKMAAVLWGEDATTCMGDIIAYASNPSSLAPIVDGGLHLGSL